MQFSLFVFVLVPWSIIITREDNRGWLDEFQARQSHRVTVCLFSFLLPSSVPHSRGGEQEKKRRKPGFVLLVVKVCI